MNLDQYDEPHGMAVIFYGYGRLRKTGVDRLRALVESCMSVFPRGLFSLQSPFPNIRRVISVLLASYAWDQRNPYVRERKQRLAALEELFYQK